MYAARSHAHSHALMCIYAHEVLKCWSTQAMVNDLRINIHSLACTSFVAHSYRDNLTNHIWYYTGSHTTCTIQYDEQV